MERERSTPAYATAALASALLAACGADSRSIVGVSRPPPPMALDAAVDVAPYVAPDALALPDAPMKDPPPQGAPLEPISSSSECALQGVEVLPGPAPLTDPQRMTLRLGVSRSTRGPQASQGASLFNVNATGADRCATRAVGPCAVRDCRPVLTSVGDRGAPLRGVLAGLVTVRGSGMQGPYVLGSGENGIYAPAPQGSAPDEPPWREDDVACVAADGFGLVPAFRAHVSFPPAPRVTSPALADPVGEVLSIRRDEGLTLTWEPVPETVSVSMSQRPSNGQIAIWLEDLSVTCTFDGAAGRAEVPAAALASFQTLADGNSSGSLSVSTRREVALAAGPVRVILSASQGVSLRAQFE